MGFELTPPLVGWLVNITVFEGKRCRNVASHSHTRLGFDVSYELP